MHFVFNYFIYMYVIVLGAVVVVWYLNILLPLQSVSIITKVVSSNPVHVEVYSIQHHVINLSVTCDRSVIFSGVIRFTPPIKQTATIELIEC